MFTLAAVLFGVAVLGGMTVFALRLRGGNPPIGLAFLHGAVAATALVVLGVATFRAGFSGLPAAALVLFSLAAMGGFVLVSMHLRGRLIPIALVVVHALIAASGLTVLLLHVLG